MLNVGDSIKYKKHGESNTGTIEAIKVYVGKCIITVHLENPYIPLSSQWLMFSEYDELVIGETEILKDDKIEFIKAIT